MDALVCLKLRPLGVWSTPWQADTLIGALACSWARSRGQDALKRDFLDPWLAGEPSFVISDAFPGDALPVPAGVPVWWEGPAEQRKEVKKRRWTTLARFSRIQHGDKPHMLERARFRIRNHIRLRNSISRDTDTTGRGGGLFEVPYSNLSQRVRDAQDSDLAKSVDTCDGTLTLYTRASSGGMEILLEALEILGRTGFGADASVGHGGFEPVREPQPCPALAEVPDADGFISLSTYQPAPTDPTDGLWRVFVKYGKLAPEFHNIAVFKRPQVMLAAGACFRTFSAPRPFYGGPIGPDRLLSPQDERSLATVGVYPVQAAFCLALPMRWPSDEKHNQAQSEES